MRLDTLAFNIPSPVNMWGNLFFPRADLPRYNRCLGSTMIAPPLAFTCLSGLSCDASTFAPHLTVFWTSTDGSFSLVFFGSFCFLAFSFSGSTETPSLVVYLFSSTIYDNGRCKPKKKMEGKESSIGETSEEAQAMQIFFDLVDREGQRQQLQNEMRTSKVVKPFVVYPRPSQLSFEMEDFGLIPSENAPGVMAKPSRAIKEEDRDEAQEERMNRGIKRQIELNPLLVPEGKVQKNNNTSRIFLYDLNKVAESLNDTDLFL
ncbi:hypothetical protein J5N97_017704 [Dioscorea zingiberensis]|uniref:Uncharacterized protein n=1 Tax=Dioscorea zingiberensis TaxID=325984 RepID=A0A9D5HGL5_9LILI|nr:hypothetical protein J5N97_017704 [Dioscorea zingiberensis]